jgi:hypothetical protein
VTIPKFDPRRLIVNVFVDDLPQSHSGTWWGPDYGNADQVPTDVAARITNPAAWATRPPENS